jgi:uncharacterized membrane protein YedE/YeeE
MKRAIYNFAALAVGLIFGVGLIVSGMFNPAKVLGFLDLAGAWDPSLAFVMAGAIAIGIAGFAVAAKRSTSLLDAPMQLPQNRRIDAQLIAGSVTFGVGWGLAGFCPGPALVALGVGQPKAVVFVIAMLLGMGAFEGLESLQRAQRSELPARSDLTAKVDG